MVGASGPRVWKARAAISLFFCPPKPLNLKQLPKYCPPESSAEDYPRSADPMEPTFVIAGTIAREYILPPTGKPLLDVPGGSALYASGGLRVWEGDLGVLASIGEDYPRKWLKQIESNGIDIGGIQILQQSLDLRAFYAYNEKFEITHGTPVSQFARRELTFPKSLLGYQVPTEKRKDTKKANLAQPIIMEIPAEYRQA